jgi:hypothetical protein
MRTNSWLLENPSVQSHMVETGNAAKLPSKSPADEMPEPMIHEINDVTSVKTQLGGLEPEVL